MNEVKALKHENGLLKGELREAKDASEKAPSAVMSALVDKLRADQVNALRASIYDVTNWELLKTDNLHGLYKHFLTLHVLKLNLQRYFCL